MSIKSEMKELVLIAGSGRLSSGVASELSLQGDYIVLIDENKAQLLEKLNIITVCPNLLASQLLSAESR